MTTVMSAAVAAILAKLNEAPAVAAVVERTRLRALPNGIAEAVNVKVMDAETGERAQDGAVLYWRARIAVELYARAQPDQAADEAIDALLERVFARLMQQPTLGVGWMFLAPEDGAGLVFDYESHGETVASVVLTLSARILTAGSSLSPFA